MKQKWLVDGQNLIVPPVGGQFYVAEGYKKNGGIASSMFPINFRFVCVCGGFTETETGYRQNF